MYNVISWPVDIAERCNCLRILILLLSWIEENLLHKNSASICLHWIVSGHQLPSGCKRISSRWLSTDSHSWIPLKMSAFYTVGIHRSIEIQCIVSGIYGFVNWSFRRESRLRIMVHNQAVLSTIQHITTLPFACHKCILVAFP